MSMAAVAELVVLVVSLAEVVAAQAQA